MNFAKAWAGTFGIMLAIIGYVSFWLFTWQWFIDRATAYDSILWSMVAGGYGLLGLSLTITLIFYKG